MLLLGVAGRPTSCRVCCLSVTLGLACAHFVNCFGLLRSVLGTMLTIQPYYISKTLAHRLCYVLPPLAHQHKSALEGDSRQ